MFGNASQSEANPSLLRELTEDQQVRLTEILDEYLRQMEENHPSSREQLIAAHPELATVLGVYLDKLDELHAMVDGEAPRFDLHGKILGDYRLIEEIGRGGMGIVFSAQQQSLRRLVAVKLLPMAALLEPKYIERFRNEARAAAQLEHPNIVPVFAVGEEGGIHFFAMKLIDGRSLDQSIALHQQAATSPSTHAALLQFADVADALHSAHEYGIVHRDIKPSNLLLDSAGKLWVADFGLARFQDERELTRTGEMIGTMRYMSPEQALGRNELVDHRTDIYSLGATLYELLTGQPAVPGEEGPSLLKTISTQAPVRLRKLRPECSRDLEIVLEKAMARHRDDRYESAREFSIDLRHVARGETISTKLVSPAVICARWAIAHSRLVSTVVCLMACLGLALSTGSYMVNTMIAKERDLAQSNLRKAHALERERTATIDQLALIPGVEDVRRNMIQSSLNYYRDFAGQVNGNPRMLDELASAYSRMGVLSEELGQPSTAVALYQQAEQLFEQLLRSGVAHKSFMLDRNANRNHMVMAMDKAGQRSEALELLDAPIKALRAQFEQGTLDQQLTVEYGLSENNLGLLLQRQGEVEAAKDAFQHAIDVLAAKQSQEVEEQAAARGLAAALHNLGALLVDDSRGKTDPPTVSEHFDRATHLLERALSIQLTLAQGSQNRLRASLDLVSTYLSIGNLHLARSAADKAAVAFNSAVQIGRKLVEIAPQVDSYRRDLAVCLSNLGMSYYQDGHTKAAQEALEESVAHYQRLLLSHPENPGIRSSLGIALNNQGIVLQDLGLHKDAELVYTRAAKLLESIPQEAVSTLQAQALNKVYVNHVRMLDEAGREQEANQLRERQIALLPHEKDAP